MNRDRFLNSSAGRVITVGTGESAYSAFVPNPLPPDLSPDNEIATVLFDAAYALGELAALGRAIPNPHLLIAPFLRREAVLSSKIEGTQTTVTDLYAYEARQLPIPGFEPKVPESDVREVANYVSALEYGLERLNTLPVSLRLIRELHERLLQGVRGERARPGQFRADQNWIGRPGSELQDAEYVPPPVAEMEAALDALEKYLHAEDRENSPLLRLASIHYQFEAIHPFRDGNGRIGRLLLSLLLVNWNLLPLPMLYLSAYFESHREQYYNLLLDVSARGAWRQWILFFLRGVSEQAHDASSRAKQLQDLRSTWRKRLIQARGSALPLQLADSLFALPVVTIPEAQRLLNVTYRSAQLNVEKLIKAGILHQIGESSYGKTYIAEDIIKAIADQNAR